MSIWGPWDLPLPFYGARFIVDLIIIDADMDVIDPFWPRLWEASEWSYGARV